MPSDQVGLVNVTGELKATGTTRWTQVRDLAVGAAWVEAGRDPAKVGTSTGISVAPMAWRMTFEPDRAAVSAMSGSPQEIEASLLAFRDACFTQVEIILEPQTLEAPDSMARVLALVKKA